MGSKLPDDLKWCEAAAAFLAETDKTSAKSVCIAVNKSKDDKDKKEAAMATVKDLAVWAKETAVFWPEPYLVTVFPTVLALCADKAKPVQLKAEEVRPAPANPKILSRPRADARDGRTASQR